MKSRGTLVIVTAAISVVATSALWIAGIAVTYQYFLGDPPPFAIAVEAPREATVGEIITLRAQVSNPTDEPLQLGSIDVYDSLLAGFTVIQVEPEPAERDDTFGFSTFYFSKTLAPGKALSFSFGLKATHPGVWTGDVDFCTPSEKFVTSSVTIRVKAEPGDAASGGQSIPLETN
jgi:hypothetical protein